MKLQFTGSDTARIFSRELEESLTGVLEQLMIRDRQSPDCGFIPVSLPGYFWDDTMWTRDTGTFLRELVLWGYLEEAQMLCQALLRGVDKNDEGYYMFPIYLRQGEKKAGSELDGTGAILIALTILYRALPDGNKTKIKIQDFLTDTGSPVFYVLSKLKTQKLIAGDGEFGGGCGIEGLYMNVVQNNLLVLALNAVSGIYASINRSELARQCLDSARLLEKNILQYLVDEDGTFIWCIRPEDMLPDEEILNEPVNRGGLVNGVLSMSADVFGFDVNEDNFYAYLPAVKQFDALYHVSSRYELFEKYGIWEQFDTMRPGCSGPSYGQGYAIQCMLLMGRKEMADKALCYLTHETYEPVPEFKLERTSPYYFYERTYSPYAVEKNTPLEVGCGALNLVCVAEPLKVGRMMAGVDNTGAAPVLKPVFTEHFSGVCAENVPLFCADKLYYADIECKKQNQSMHLHICVKKDVLPKLTVMTDAGVYELSDVTELTVQFPF